ncbi:MAG: DNA polymerase III subunit gamma/tau, partial [Xanthomonadales bacterium]|nr:DNA polymerase III subunit gamma/tau [Xanthomonadales bacterium]
CLRFNLSRLLPDQIGGQLKKILQAESVEAESPAIMRIARAADGSMRDGLSLLDQAIAYGGGSLRDAEVANMLGSIDYAHIEAIIDALVRSDAGSLLGTVQDLVRQSRRLETALEELAEAMHRIALIHAAPDFRDPERADWDSLVEFAGRISPEDAQLYYQIAVTGCRDLELAPDPRTGLEMTLLRMLAFRPGDGNSPAPSSGPAGDKAGSDKEAARKAREALEEMQQGESTGQLELQDRVSKSVSEPAAAESPPDWFNLQESLELSGAARELARNLQLESAGKVRWRFLVPDTLQHLGTPSVVQDLQSALSERLGQSVLLDLHTASEPVESVAAIAQRQVDDRFSEAERVIKEDPTVQEIKDKFGAQIVPDTIQPLQ